MANFFKSDEVKVYPCSFRGYKTDKTAYNAKARLITEEGFIRPVAVGALDSYVISSVVDADNEECLKVVVGGYYFEINHKNYTGFSHLYIATRTITTNGEEQTVLASLGDNKESLDSNGYFTGIAYGNSIPDGDYIGLQVFENDGSKTLYSNACLPSYDVEKGSISLNGNSVQNKRSAAFGTGTHAQKIDNEFVVGKYNDDAEALFIVGDGATDKRHNAFSTGSVDGTKINENTAITGTLDVIGKTTLEDTLQVSKESILNDKLTITKNGITVEDGGINVTGDATFNNAIKANSATITNSTSTGTLSVNNAATVGGALSVNGESVLSDKLSITKAGADINGSTKITGDLTITQTATVSDAASFNDKIQIGKYSKDSGINYNSTIDKEGNATFAKALEANTANITSAATIGTTLAVKGKTKLLDNLTISKGGITIKGDSSIDGKLTASSSKDSSTNRYSDNAVIIKSDLLDLIYPIGSIYMLDPIQLKTTPSSDNCPIAKRLGGTWQVIEADFLRCETEAVTEKNLKDGSDSAWLMNHNHTVSSITGTAAHTDLQDVFYLPRGEYSRWSAAIYNTDKKWTFWGTSAGNHITLAGGYHGTPHMPAGVTYNNETLQEMQLRPNQNYGPVSIKIDMSHSHDLTNMTANIDNKGDIASDNSTVNRPHYRKVYAWIRTA